MSYGKKVATTIIAIAAIISITYILRKWDPGFPWFDKDEPFIICSVKIVFYTIWGISTIMTGIFFLLIASITLPLGACIVLDLILILCGQEDFAYHRYDKKMKRLSERYNFEAWTMLFGLFIFIFLGCLLLAIMFRIFGILATLIIAVLIIAILLGD